MFLTDRQVRSGHRCSTERAIDHGDYRPSHVGLCVRDLDRSLRFFCDGLGFEKVEGFEMDSTNTPGLERSLEVPGPVKIVSQFVQNDTMKIELLHFMEPGVGGDAVGDPQPGRAHAPLLLRRRPRRRHRAPRRVWRDRDRGDAASPGIDLLFLADPDGVRVELMALPA